MRSLFFVSFFLVVSLVAGSIGAQTRSGGTLVRYNKPLKTATIDLDTGTVIRGPTDRLDVTSVVDFRNMDLGGFVGADTGLGFCRWFDAGVKGQIGNASDLMSGIIFAYDFDLERGTLSNKRPFAAPKGYGDPDGSTVDAEGYVWNARWNAACVIRFAPDGSIDRVVDVPAPLVTCPAFGGEHLDTLYITCARCDMTPEQHAQYPLGGALFAFKPGVRGLQRPNFAG